MIDEIDEMDDFYRKYLEFQGEVIERFGSRFSRFSFGNWDNFYFPFSSWTDILYHESCENWSLHISEHSISWRSMWKDFP